MYGLPAGFDALRFVGHTLEQVTFVLNNVSLFFDGDVSIRVESCFTHSTREKSEHTKPVYFPVRESSLMKLLGESIVSARALESGTLFLKFSNGHTFACHDPTPGYEAYHITIGDEEIHV